MSTRHSYLSTTGLIRDPSNAASVAPSTHANSGGTKPGQNRSSRKKPLTVAKAGILPLGPAFIVAIAMAFSLVFILSLSFAFVGSDDDEPKFKSLLEDIANNSPGIVLLGDNIDIDVDEPAVTIRWSVIGCGSEFVLPGSQGTHGSTSCGVPSVPLKVFVDGLSDPKFSYDPTQTPFASGTGQRLSVQNLFQFDSDHVLDVHEARLYPFDTYHLTSTLRAASSDGDQPIVLSALTTITMTSRFIVNPTDVASYMNTSDYDAPSRDVQLYITRPGEARAWTLLLFGVSWMLAHFTVALVVLARTLQGGEERLLRYLLLAFVILLSIPQLRNAMPDAPGFDGVLIGAYPKLPSMQGIEYRNDV
ncbi:hypothetical protein AcW2_007429 [Taiwanofungus camphoratus]|nr:hypothetical protein AcW2_007429 [Antrodia cinnamomea]